MSSDFSRSWGVGMGPGARNTTRALRRGNRAVLLRALYAGGPISRQDLSRETGLSQATVSTLVSELVAEGLVAEAGTVESDGGRPRVLLSIDPAYGHLVGVDVGETRVRVELFDMRLNGLAKAEYALAPGEQGPEETVAHILDGLRLLAGDTGVGPDQILGAGIGVPGVVSRAAEPLVDAPTVGWRQVPLAALLRAGTGLPLHVENGAKALGRAEQWFGAGRDVRHMIVALLGTGVGAAVVTGGTVYRGVTSSAGEWGHTVVERDGRRCRCGRRGCLEAYVGARAILERYRELEPDAVPAGLGDESGLAAMLARAETGDPAARRVFAETAGWLGLGIANMVNLFNPERFLLAGWTGGLLCGAFLDDIRAATRRSALPALYDQVTIAPGTLGPDAVALGAATLVVDDFLT